VVERVHGRAHPGPRKAEHGQLALAVHDVELALGPRVEPLPAADDARALPDRPHRDPLYPPALAHGHGGRAVHHLLPDAVDELVGPSDARRNKEGRNRRIVLRGPRVRDGVDVPQGRPERKALRPADPLRVRQQLPVARQVRRDDVHVDAERCDHAALAQAIDEKHVRARRCRHGIENRLVVENADNPLPEVG